MVGAVIAAAGSSSRMQGIDKQRLELDGIPVIARSLLCMERSPLVRDIVLVCREDDIADMLRISRDYSINKLISIVKGACTRQKSVFEGINALPPDTEYYAVHDGARPFADDDLIRRCIAAAIEHGCAAPGVRVKDTIKEVDEDGFIAATPSRERLFITQTPQVFEAGAYREAMQLAIEQGQDYTDDCQLMEAVGRRVYMTQGSYDNIKITTPEDISVGEAIAMREEDGGFYI